MILLRNVLWIHDRLVARHFHYFEAVEERWLLSALGIRKGDAWAHVAQPNVGTVGPAAVGAGKPSIGDSIGDLPPA
jgi:hypothetical protein